MLIGAILTFVAAIVGFLFGSDGWLGALLVGGAFGLATYLTEKSLVTKAVTRQAKDSIAGSQMRLSERS